MCINIIVGEIQSGKGLSTPHNSDWSPQYSVQAHMTFAKQPETRGHVKLENPEGTDTNSTQKGPGLEWNL